VHWEQKLGPKISRKISLKDIFYELKFTHISGNKIPITPNPNLRVLFPTIEILGQRIEGNFDGPFEYDIDECPGLELN
jgi:hypothetical protein